MNSKNKKKSYAKTIIIVFLIVVVISLMALYFLKPKSINDEEIKMEKSDITTYYNFNGNIEAKNKQIVYAERTLQIKEFNIEKGQKVSKGTTLFTTTMGEEIIATIDGEVTDIIVEKGQQIMPGNKIMNIIDYDNLQLSVNVDEYDLAAVTVDKEAKIVIYSLDKNINGKVMDVAKEGTELNGITYFKALISIDKDNALRVGMSAEAKILNQNLKNVPTLPMSAIQFDDNNKPYVRVKQNQKSIRKNITLGITDGINVEIKKGINLKDAVLVPEKQNMGFTSGRMRNSNNNNQNNNNNGMNNGGSLNQNNNTNPSSGGN